VSDQDPLTAFRFFITLDDADAYLPPEQAELVAQVALGAFQEVKGLGGELEVTPYPEGGANDFVHQLPGRYSWGRITLRRGITLEPGLWDWYQAGFFGSSGARRNGAIILLTPSGETAMSWAFRAGLAAKWIGPDLGAQENAMAIEGLEIAHEGLTRVISGSEDEG